MKVAYITCHPDMRGGGERFVYETALRLRKLGHEVVLFCNSMDPAKAYPEMLEIPHKVFPARRNLFGYFTAYFGLKAIRKIIEESIKWRPDVIFLHMGYVFAGYFQKLTDTPIVPFVHYPETFQPHKKSWLRNIYRGVLKIRELETLSFENVPIILCNSYHTEETIHELAPNANTKVVYPGVDHEKFKPTWEDEGYLYYHSRFQSPKNQLLAIQASGKYSLVLSGFLNKTNLKYYTQVYREASKRGHKVLTNIDDDDFISLLQKCSVFLFPSIKEHFGIAPIEAMACGKPVIGHRSGGTIETVGEVGTLCGDHVREWSKAISYLMENPDIRKDMGKKSWELSKHFTWENTVNQIVETFNSLQ